MSRAGAGLPAVAAFTLVVPMLATPAVAAQVDAPQLPVQPPQYLPAPESAPPWLAVGANVAGTPVDDEYDLHGFEQEDADNLALTAEPVVSDDLGLVQPSFSPDGSRIVFSAQQSTGQDAAWHLMVGDVGPAADGPSVTGVQPLDYPTVIGAADYQPAWSPDGQHIAFVREYSPGGPRADDGPQVQVLEIESETLTEITLPDGPDNLVDDSRWSSDPTWSPDGTGLMLIANLGDVPIDAFAPADPDIQGTGSLWYYDLEGSAVHHLTVSEDGCGDTNSCDVPIDAETAAWSPADPAAVAYTPSGLGGVYLLTDLPADLPAGGTADVSLPAGGSQLVTDTEPPAFQELAWDPDGSAVYAIVSGSPEVQRITPAGESDLVYEDTTTFPFLLGLAYQPWSDLGITLDVPGNPAAGTTFTATAEVTNTGPSPSRPGQVQIEVPAQATVDTVPGGCTGPVGQVVSCALDPLAVDESTTVELELTLDAPAAGTVSATVASASPDPDTTGAADNRAAAAVVAYPPPDGRSRRISFTLDRPHEIVPPQRYSEDLVQSVVPAEGEDPIQPYRVLADEEYDQIEPPVGDPIPGPYLADEDSIDYSPDGSRVAYERWSQQNSAGDGETSDWRELVVADVVGAQSGDEAGSLTDATVIATGPDPEFDEYSDYEPVWSPDGTQIAFVRDPSWPELGSRLLLYDVATGEVTRPVDPDWRPETSQSRYLVSEPTWSPDGSGLIFSADDGSGDATLWYLQPSSGPATPQPLLGPDGEDLIGRSPAWSPDGTMLAFTSNAELEREALYLVGLPESIAAGQPVQTTSRARAEQFDDLGIEEALVVWDPTWSPDGTQIAVATREFAAEGARNELMAVDLPSGEVADLPDAPVIEMFAAGSLEYIAGPEYEPYSDVSVTIDTDGPAQPGTGTDVTVTVTNGGPSPARDAIVTLPLPDGVTAGSLPEGCTVDGASLTCELPGPVPVGAEVPLTIPVTTADAGSYDLATTVATNSIDPQAANDEATATLTASTGDSERIAFSMERAGDSSVETVNEQSLDLVRSLTTEPGDAAATDYTVLADSVLDEVEDIGDSDNDLGPLLATENSIDYSADGSRAVFNRSAAVQYDFTDDQRLVIADVVGTQQTGLGEAGALLNLEEIEDAPGALPTDPALYDRVSDTEPVFSPDGTQIAFVRALSVGDGEGAGQITLLDAASHEMTSPFDPDWLAETGTGLDMGSPTWSPGGDALIFDARAPGQDAPVLQYLPLSTGIPHPLALPEDGSVCWPDFGGDFCAGPVHGWQPAWSPGGEQVAFEYYASGGIGIAVLTVDESISDSALDPDWTQPLPIAGLTGVDAFIPDEANFPPVASPAWSPDGERIAVAQGGTDYPDQIVAATLAGGDVTTMFSVPDVGTDLARPEFEPWSDIGVTIARASGAITTSTSSPVTVTVTNNGPSPARDAFVTVTLPRGAQAGTLPRGCTADGRTLTCELPGPIATGDEVPLTIPVTFTADGDHRVTATVATNSIDPEAGNDSAARTFTVTDDVPPDAPDGRTARSADVQVQISLDADRAWLGGDGLPAQITVTNTGPNRAANVQLTLTLPDQVLTLDAGPCPLEGACDLGPIASGDQVSVDLLLQPTAVGQLELAASATSSTRDTRPRNNTDSAGFEAVQAQLRLLPAVATPGEVTLLYGVDLPPDAEITVRWSEGITSVYRPVAANDDGTLRQAVLIVDGDQLGRRDLQITSVAGTAFGLETPPTMLVVPPSVAPPNFLGRS